MINNKLFSTLSVSLILLSSSAYAAREEVKDQSIEIIDAPTAEILDHYGYFENFRFGTAGALQTKTAFGVLPRLNLGFGLDGEQVIGTGSARLNKPTINVKFRFFDGEGWIPAMALGYDGQGYVWNKDINRYQQREMGFYFAATHEIFVPDLNWTFGVNRSDFESGGATRGFTGLEYVYHHTVGFEGEYVNAFSSTERRINFGLKYFVTPVFTVEAIGRNIPNSVNTTHNETERIVRLAYRGAF